MRRPESKIMEKKMYISDESGIALVIALVMLLALTVIGISSMLTSTVDVQMSGNERRSAEALNLADAGIEIALHDLLYDYKHDMDWSNVNLFRLSLSSGSQVTNTLAAAAGDFDSDTDSQWGDPFGSANIGGSTGSATAHPLGLQTLGGGVYKVLILRDSGEPNEVYARAYAEQTNTGARKIIQLHMSTNKIDVWRNAVFAGSGSATAAITGNIKVAGPMHILATGNVNTYTVRGDAGVLNGYLGLGSNAAPSYTGSELIGRIDMSTLDTVGEYNGKPVYSLGSEMRVKNVKVVVSGAASIGEPGDFDMDGNTVNDTLYQSDTDTYWKSRLDGIYSNEQIEGQAHYADNVNADWSHDDYDLGDKIQMPSFEDPYIDNEGNNWDTYKEYIETKSITIPSTTACSLQPDTSKADVTPTFCLGTLNDAACTGGDFTVACDPAAEGCIKWDPNSGDKSDPAILKIEGRVKFDNDNCTEDSNGDGTPDFKIGRSSDSIRYEGKGLIYGDKTMYVAGSLVTDNSDGGKFVQDDLMGLLTTGSIHMAEAGDNNPILMGGFFAGDIISTEQPSQIMGSIVSNQFCLGGTHEDPGPPAKTVCTEAPSGGQASDIYYVPELSDEITKLGMIKGSQVFTFDDYEWEEKF